MSYTAKTNWQLNEIVMPVDMNRIEQGIKDLDLQKLAKSAISVSSGTNLNNCKEIGMYTWSSADSSGIGNCPETEAQATMLVLPRSLNNSGNFTQIVITQNNQIYFRQLADDIWGKWSDGPDNFMAIKKYNIPSVAKTFINNLNLNVNPIPTSWAQITETISYQNNGYIVNSAAQNTGNQTYLAFDGKIDTYWGIEIQSSAWISIELPEALTISKMKLRLEATGTGASGYIIQGSNDNSSWTDLYTNSGTSMPNTLTEIALTATGSYKYYRIYFPVDDTTNLKTFRVYEFKFSSYTIPTYRIDYGISEILKTRWVQNQILLIETPNNYNTVGVKANALNGISINDMILQPNKRYELVYVGSGMFITREVI